MSWADNTIQWTNMTMPDILGWRRTSASFCQGTDDGDDGAFICCSFQDLSVMYDTGH